jgi:hypothetical protein
VVNLEHPEDYLSNAQNIFENLKAESPDEISMGWQFYNILEICFAQNTFVNLKLKVHMKLSWGVFSALTLKYP